MIGELTGLAVMTGPYLSHDFRNAPGRNDADITLLNFIAPMERGLFRLRGTHEREEDHPTARPMFPGRCLPGADPLIIGGLLHKKKYGSPSPGTLSAESYTFALFLFVITAIVGAPGFFSPRPLARPDFLTP